MNWIDAIILLVVLAIIGGVITFSILSHKRGNVSCSKCAYAKDCAKQKKIVQSKLASKECCKNSSNCNHSCCERKDQQKIDNNK